MTHEPVQSSSLRGSGLDIANLKRNKKEMTFTKDNASKRARRRWGDTFSCRAINGTAVCKFNGKEIIGKGKDTVSAIQVALKQITKL